MLGDNDFETFQGLYISLLLSWAWKLKIEAFERNMCQLKAFYMDTWFVSSLAFNCLTFTIHLLHSRILNIPSFRWWACISLFHRCHLLYSYMIPPVCMSLDFSSMLTEQRNLLHLCFNTVYLLWLHKQLQVSLLISS